MVSTRAHAFRSCGTGEGHFSSARFRTSCGEGVGKGEADYTLPLKYSLAATYQDKLDTVSLSLERSSRPGARLSSFWTHNVTANSQLVAALSVFVPAVRSMVRCVPCSC